MKSAREERPPNHIKSLGDIEHISIQVAALTELLGLSMSQYQAAVQRGEVVRTNNKRPLLVATLRNYILRVNRTEETAIANHDRIQAQVDFTRQRQEKEKLKMRQLAGELIDVERAADLARELAVATRQFCEQMINETCRRVAPKARRSLRDDLRTRIDAHLTDYADRIAKL